MKPKIFAFNNGGSPDWLRAVAIAESGHVVGGHICSDEGFIMQHDIGVTSNWHHDEYAKHYPDGFEVVWVPTSEIFTHPGLQAALAKNKELEKCL